MARYSHRAGALSSAANKGAFSVHFGFFEHIDHNDPPRARQYDERLELIELAERLT
jgi:hypothetical protein